MVSLGHNELSYQGMFCTKPLFSGVNSTLAGIPLMILVKIGNFFSKTCLLYILSTPWLFGISCQYFHFAAYSISDWPNCCKGKSFEDIKAINCGNACRGPYGTSIWHHSMHEQSIHCIRDKSSVRWWSPAARTSPIGSNQVWRLCEVGLLLRIWAKSALLWIKPQEQTSMKFLSAVHEEEFQHHHSALK